ncbi:MAG: histidine phosphatase family protein [Burkholderiales bacterium]|nr:histidine phosphatase family protein [Burkholderiales bacterium]
MAELYLVRHAQAAFGTDDYDRLTELGHRQARWLGEYFAERGMAFDRVLAGTLRRHRETLAGIIETDSALPAAEAYEGLNEYRADALITAYQAARGLPPVAQGADRRTHFRLLREVLYAWADGTLGTDAHPSFATFSAGVRATLDRVREGAARRVLVVSSGGPISTLLGAVLGLAPRMMMNLNLQTRNSAISELAFNSRAVHFVSFNGVPHLDRPERRAAITYS